MHRLTHTSYVFSLFGSLQVKSAKKYESKGDVPDRKSSKKKTKKMKAEEEVERILSKEEEELEPKSPGHTAHISISKINLSALALLDDDDDNVESDDGADFFDDENDDEAIPMQAAIGIKKKASEHVRRDKEEKAVVKAKTKKEGTKETKKEGTKEKKKKDRSK
jgi:hypothetical protein